MSGIEAVGLVVGILPLLISTAEYYDTVTRPFKRYRKFVPELELYQQQLGAQKTIFRNECRLLLATLTGGHLAKEMLKETKHASWSDNKLDEDLAHQLGDSGQACHNIIEAIKTKLKAVEEDADNFGHAIQQSIPERSIGDKAWRSRVAKKFKFSVAEPRLEKNIQALRKLNQDFLNLAQQTTRLEDCGNKAVVDWNDIPLQSDRKVQECRTIQIASERLYNALRKACQTHSRHSAHFRLDSRHIDDTGQEQSLVRFTIGFAHGQGDSVVAEPVWITIDSILEEPNSEENGVSPVQPEACKALKGLSDSLKREFSKSAAPSKRLKTKSVSFTVPPSSSNSNAATFATTFNMSLPDF